MHAREDEPADAEAIGRGNKTLDVEACTPSPCFGVGACGVMLHSKQPLIIYPLHGWCFAFLLHHDHAGQIRKGTEVVTLPVSRAGGMRLWQPLKGTQFREWGLWPMK